MSLTFVTCHPPLSPTGGGASPSPAAIVAVCREVASFWGTEAVAAELCGSVGSLKREREGVVPAKTEFTLILILYSYAASRASPPPHLTHSLICLYCCPHFSASPAKIGTVRCAREKDGEERHTFTNTHLSSHSTPTHPSSTLCVSFSALNSPPVPSQIYLGVPLTSITHRHFSFLFPRPPISPISSYIFISGSCYSLPQGPAQ